MQRQVRQLSLAALLALTASSCTKDKDASAPVSPGGSPAAAPGAEPFAVSFAARGSYAAGQGGAATITVAARDGFHVNPDYPVAFKPAPASTVKFSAERVPLTDGKKTPCAQKAEDACQVDFELPFTPEGAGTGSVQGVLAFSVCSEQKCLIEKVPLTLAINVQ